MARITLNLPNAVTLQWTRIQHSFSARQITAAVFCCILLGVLLFAFMEMYLVGSTGYHSSTDTHGSHRSVPTGDPHPVLGPGVRYGIVIDCGSSGSRIYVYFWPPHSGNARDLLNIQQLMGQDGKPVVKKITPGLDKFENNPGAASEYIRPLLKFAASYIPKEQQKEALLFILATAGMRMISSTAQKAIFNDLKTDIAKEFPFVISDSNLEVISGKLEGVYAWIAVNYALRKFDHGEEEHPLVAVEVPGQSAKRTHIRRRTVGMIDMGGGSMQIAFEVTSKSATIPPHRVVEFNLGCQQNDFDHTYRVYVSTFLGFGANEARDRYEVMLTENADHSNVTQRQSDNTENSTLNSHFSHNHGKRVLPDPCLPPGLFYEREDEEGHTYFFHGTGDYLVCQKAVYSLLNLSAQCEQEACSMNGVHQPEIPYQKTEFYGFSEFWYTMQDIFRKGGLYDHEDFQKDAQKFCSTKWATLQSRVEQNLYPKADDQRMKLQCFKSAWMTSVLHQGLKFPQTYHQLHSVNLINSRDIQWTLGALIHRTRYLPLRDVERFETQHAQPSNVKSSWSLYNSYVIIVCIFVVVMAILLYMHRLQVRLCPTRKDLKRVPSHSFFNTDEDPSSYQYA
ncbi:ectonucleoside triphosphate diphosphohydrolase 7-like [Mizuhopecten yessoensis]|uniref:Ectonucleoside triphosphate diphosphohydrolase 7 n=1 Tax=Mizuhopecten yessoensis TaxID=6573 RepID=A0A210Q1U6_MIZYE|nr:ectonucleoside triphosphate diphosphohydrolase 7-like [Mizuhopecten yessoensis]OWF42723.1 Ectonucleoside triphosphate diphosphohydrolase 7 [Mizuhopecten yessoensis]